MHVHLPKPLHGWREFVGEVGIIVIGVLVALAAEQFVETLHWQHAAEHAQDTLRQEIADHYFDATEIVMAQPCIDQQLVALERPLLKAGKYVPAPTYHTGLGDFPYRAPTRVWADNTWKTASADGTVQHFDGDLRLKLSAYYASLASMGEANRETDLLWFGLRVLSQPIEPDGSTRTNLIQQLEQARGQFAFMKLSGNQVLGMADVMGMRPTTSRLAYDLSQSGTLQFCRAHHLPLGKAEPDHTVFDQGGSDAKAKH